MAHYSYIHVERTMKAVLLVRFLTIATITIGIVLCNENLGATCKEGEKQALLKFKQDVKDPSNRLSSWFGEGDCCNWAGVVCHNLTGRIRELHLGNPNSWWDLDSWIYFNNKSTWLGGKVNPSLLNLSHLNYLDLSYNKFQGTPIPSFLGSLKSLRYLNLSEAGFEGIIPPQLGNLSNLHYLGLRHSKLKVENLQWISGLSHLTNLDMSYVDLSKASDWLQLTNMLPSLVELRMISCGLHHIPSLGLATINFTSLSTLDLSENKFNTLVPRWVFSLKNLVSLHLRACGFQGSIPSRQQNITSSSSLTENDLSLEHLCKLVDLDMSSNNFIGNVSEILESLSLCSSDRIESLLLGYNNLSGHLTEHLGDFKNLMRLRLSANSISGPIPESIGDLSYLMELIISNNQFNGTLPQSIGQLKMLTFLDISYNSFEGVVSEVHFTNLTKLEHFIARGNSLTLKTSRDWLPPFQLQRIWLDYWHLGPDFPMWLRKQAQLVVLSLPNTGISDTIPTWFSNISSQLLSLNLSHNQLYGEIQNIGGRLRSSIDLSSNQFTGSLPLVSSTVGTLDLSNSSFSGSLFHFFCDRMSEPKELYSLHLGENLLSGNIPNCWMNWKNLVVLNLKGNNLTGNVPTSIGFLHKLTSLQLHNNQLSGELPLSMQNCTSLLVVDLGKNKLVGSLPTWMGKSLSNLKVLNIRSNELQGDIPYELCYLKNLQIMDLANNSISGTIPRCFHNFSAMASLTISNTPISIAEYVMDNVMLVTKGREMEYYFKMLRLVISIDLSDNIISGEIPEELASLLGLRSLNLSKNLLTGSIPSKIGNMKWLESVDLSMNQLYGEIPQGVRSLTFLSHLNLSYNNFTGQIPKSTQLQSLDQSSFIGNHLCGPPLNDDCGTANRMIPPTFERDRGYHLLEDKWFYLSLGIGFMLGFWSVLGSLLVNMPWSRLLSQFLNNIVFKLHAVIVKFIS